MKIISFCLFNKRHKDTINMIVNCMLSPHIYYGWKIIVYVDETIPKEIDELLHTFSHVEVIYMSKHSVAREAMFWRFLPIYDKKYEYVIIRDADSWVSSREKVCVDEWISSGKNFHIIRDHCYHSHKIMGGMWGVKGGTIPNIKELIDDYIKYDDKCQGFLANVIYPKMLNDQNYLANHIYPHVSHNMMIHLGNQYDNTGAKANGYFNDGGVPIPLYKSYDEPIPGFSFKQVHEMNKFNCAHCKTVHETYIGAILEKIPEEVKKYVGDYANKHNINLDNYLSQWAQ